MTTTTNYGMQLPAGTDPASITPINQNTTFLDTKLKELEDVTDSVIDEIDKTTSSESGSVITLTDESPSTPLKSCVCDIEPVQDLNGYDHPWVGGAGKNKLPLVLSDIKSANTSGTWSGNSYALNDVTFDVLTDSADNIEGIKVSGTASATTTLKLVGDVKTALSVGASIIVNGCPSNGSRSTFYIQANNIGYDTGSGVSGSVPSTTSPIFIVVENNVEINTTTFYPMIRLSTESDATFEPYTNICPISGWSGITLTVADDHDNPTDSETTTLTWTDAGTVYGGSIDLTSGVLTKTHENIASYNGESINEPWLSSMDEYTEGGTPTTGAQVVYPLTTAVTYQLTPQTIKTLSSSPTNLWADTGDTSATYVVKDEYSYSGIPTVEAVKQYVMDMLGI